jgi:hypothetical protein
MLGASLAREGQWKDALDHFTRAESIVHSPTHVLFIGKAELQLGQLVQAHESLLKVTNETPPAGASAAFVEAEGCTEGSPGASGSARPNPPIVVSGDSRCDDGDGRRDRPPALVDVPHP